MLVVDRSSAVCARLAASLSDEAFEVVGEANDVVAAVALTARLTPDAIVTDILFPDLRGTDVVRQLREIAPDAQLVVVSNAEHYRVSCLACGADAFLDKSTQLDELAAALRHRVH